MLMASKNEKLIYNNELKGFPPRSDGITQDDWAGCGWNLLQEDVPLPAAVLRKSALVTNSAWMREFLDKSGARLSPHGKTSMSPQLFEIQKKDGCWAITLATCHQVRVAREFGVNRIILANQIVGKCEIEYIFSELSADPAFDFYCFVDSVEGVKRLATSAKAAGLQRPLKLLIEGGFNGGRCGCRTVEDAINVASEIIRSDSPLALAGVAGFEGLYQYRKNEDRVTLVGDFLDFLILIAKAVDNIDAFGTDEIMLSAGGSAFYDIVVSKLGNVSLSKPVAVVSRSGCYLTHDSQKYEQLQNELLARSVDASSVQNKLTAALEVWSYVLSTPEPELIILSAGRRDFGEDAGNPVPIKWARPGVGLIEETLSGVEVVGVSDQHAHVRVPPGHSIRFGDMIGMGVSHPCTTFDKWKMLYVVDDDYRIVDAVRTYF